MTTELTVTDFTREQIDLIKRTICKDATDDELALFLHACKKTGLDPLTRQIYALKRRENVDGQWVEKMTYQTGIDGYRLIADRTGRYAPGRSPTFSYDKEGYLQAATAYVKKLTADGTWHEVEATAHYREYVALKKDGSPNRMWNDKPHIMLSKCAEALALKRAFPMELSPVYTTEEMEQADNPRVEVRQAQPALPDPEKVAAARKTLENGGADPITEKQLTKLVILCDETGFDKAALSQMFPKKVSRKQLTKAEASRLIDHLEDVKAKQEEDEERAAIEAAK